MEQCPVDIPERMGEEMSRSQGYIFASDSGIDDESESIPSPSISITSNPMRKRALSESATQTTPRKSPAAEHDHRDQMTQWSTPDLDPTEDNEKGNTGGTPTTILLLCNSCWCHWCQRPWSIQLHLAIHMVHGNQSRRDERSQTTRLNREEYSRDGRAHPSDT